MTYYEEDYLTEEEDFSEGLSEGLSEEDVEVTADIPEEPEAYLIGLAKALTGSPEDYAFTDQEVSLMVGYGLCSCGADGQLVRGHKWKLYCK